MCLACACKSTRRWWAWRGRWEPPWIVAMISQLTTRFRPWNDEDALPKRDSLLPPPWLQPRCYSLSFSVSMAVLMSCCVVLLHHYPFELLSFLWTERIKNENSEMGLQLGRWDVSLRCKNWRPKRYPFMLISFFVFVQYWLKKKKRSRKLGEYMIHKYNMCVCLETHWKAINRVNYVIGISFWINFKNQMSTMV